MLTAHLTSRTTGDATYDVCVDSPVHGIAWIMRSAANTVLAMTTEEQADTVLQIIQFRVSMLFTPVVDTEFQTVRWLSEEF